MIRVELHYVVAAENRSIEFAGDLTSIDMIAKD
jgi:hypothetical protein